MEEFSPHHLVELKERGYQVVVIMKEPDKIILMPLKNPAPEEQLKFMDYKQVSITDPMLESIAKRQGIMDKVVIRFSDSFDLS